MEKGSTTTIEGVVENVIYRNEHNGFTVMEILYNGDTLTVVGELLDISVGEELKIEGSFSTHHSYGHQFKATYFEKIMPNTESGILRYLSGGAIKGIGPVLAKKLVQEFGEQTLDIMENSPERLSEVKGISPKLADNIANEYKRLFGIRLVMLFLSRFSLSPSVAVTVFKRWGNHTQEIISSDPYLLCSEDIGVEFSVADSIADSLGIAADAQCRVKGGIMYVLTFNLLSGHSCLPEDRLVRTVSEMIECAEDLVSDVLFELCISAALFSEKNRDKTYIYLPHQYVAEDYVATRVNLMLDFSVSDIPVSESELAELEEELSIDYAAEQRLAITSAVKDSIMILTGGPGTGKTTTLKGILTLLQRRGMKVALCAPTGRAAKRISELTGHEAKTIHRLLEVDFSGDDKNALRFKRKENNPLPFDVIIADEMSMVDVRLFESLLRALRLGTGLVLVGDPDQLPSVGSGNVLGDLIASEAVNTVHLTHIFRQATESQIVVNAHKIVAGEMLSFERKDSDVFFLGRRASQQALTTVVDLCKERLPNAYNYSPLRDIQVITPSRIGDVGTGRLNTELQAALNPKAKEKQECAYPGGVLREGDKVMQVRNNYDISWVSDSGEEGVGIFNGDIGFVETISRRHDVLTVKFDDKLATYPLAATAELELAYAITVHKSQGSEFNAVVIPLLGRHKRLHYRNLLYTAVTRAKKLLVFVGHTSTVAEMIANKLTIKRFTLLTERIKNF